MQVLAAHGILGLSHQTWWRSGATADVLPRQLRELDGRGCKTEASVERADLLQSIGQQQLLLGRTEEAAEYFHWSAKSLPVQPRPELQARSCLITGLQSLHRHQLRTAWSCLQRVIDTRQASPELRLQAHGAMAALYFGLGMRRPASASVARAMELLGQMPGPHELPKAAMAALRAEFVVEDVLRQHDRLQDLAFWPRHEEVAGSRNSVAQAREAVSHAREAAGDHPFLRARLAFLESLLDIAYDGETHHAPLFARIQQLQDAGLVQHVIGYRHELALACIAARQVEPLRQALLCYTGSEQRGRETRHVLEHEYCLAKLAELGGREDLCIAHYRTYAQQALTHLRQTCAYITVPTEIRQAAAEIPKDDIASRLPGKYRRAYQYMVANLHRDDLSVHDVAEAVGVTERALQLAFRAALGLSPSAVIRQCRMDRVRDELSNGDLNSGATTLEVGRRWGLRSRSALSQAYRASFGVLPSQTVGVTVE